MKSVNTFKLIQFLEQNKESLSDWHIKFVSDVKHRITHNQTVSEKQKVVLFEETRRIFFIKHINIFED